MVDVTKKENNFKFGLYLGNEPICERIFSADVYNHATRTSVDIRELTGGFIKNFQKTLETKKPVVEFENYSFLKYYTDNSVDNSKLSKIRKPFKMGLYVNDFVIIEREFEVYNYNPAVRFSIDIVNIVNEIVFDIENHLKIVDSNYMNDDNLISNKYFMNLQKVKSLDKLERRKLLDKIYSFN